MKMIFHYSKFLLICIGIICLLPSCSRYLGTVDGNKIKRKVFIKITGIVPKSTDLIMTDENGKSADHFVAYSGQKVIWEIEDKAEIKSLDGFPLKPSFKNVNIYSKKPGKRFLSKKWLGKLLVVTKPVSVEYTIYWTDKATGEKKPFDPIMQLNPIK